MFYVVMVVMQPSFLTEYLYQKQKGGTYNEYGGQNTKFEKKQRNISRRLADKIGVSQQAVSKWESEQSSPDIEKIIILSDYFDVTTDYLLKGIEPITDVAEEKADARIFSVIGTALNFIGLVVAIMI